MILKVNMCVLDYDYILLLGANSISGKGNINSSTRGVQYD
jgi:hypothetical protein